jgi:hypothetical protein
VAAPPGRRVRRQNRGLRVRGPVRFAGTRIFGRSCAAGIARRGIGDTILENCRPHAIELGATTISGRVAANDAGSLRWVVDRGYIEVGRDVELVRELGEEPPSVSPPGIEIKEVTAAEHDAVYAVAVECWPDMPTTEPIPAPAYDDWAQEELRGPVVFGAFDAGYLVGYAALVTRPASPEVLEHGLPLSSAATVAVESRRG